MSPDEIQDLRERLMRLETKVDTLATIVAKICGSYDSTSIIIKFVVTPLLLILGALIGIKLVQP